MREFLTATLTFPTVVFSFALIVVIVYWLVSLAGAIDHDLFETDLTQRFPVYTTGGDSGVSRSRSQCRRSSH